MACVSAKAPSLQESVGWGGWGRVCVLVLASSCMLVYSRGEHKVRGHVASFSLCSRHTAQARRQLSAALRGVSILTNVFTESLGLQTRSNSAMPSAPRCQAVS